MIDEQGEPLALVVNPQPFSGAHFAVFSPKLVQPMIKASTSERGCCPECGAPWQRQVERTFQPQADVRDHGRLRKGSNKGLDASNGWSELPRGTVNSKTLGWQPTCGHTAEPVPCQVLDPFAGACSTLIAAARLGRDSTGIELGRQYAEMGRDRMLAEAPLLVEVTIE